ncbi:MFS general substrate transporter [Rhizoclosmatium globosum]|uniref:MFS general substrate transporter n=1 Tax=Rhizoclosmatium globosum TaxID=329046 RepID=A0A1Y2C522_9FUNG|nr:MFS general substrate transporter [Rhizoclosmatium globosum]|eukprot:ORY41977.1 MFS general substrate transporter [Rhizoclosmatium globosum]
MRMRWCSSKTKAMATLCECRFQGCSLFLLHWTSSCHLARCPGPDNCCTALKSIVYDFGKQDLIPWIGSSYLMTAAPLGTLYGKFADIFGRKWVFVFAITVFEIGSLLCGAATSMEFLIVGRAIAGVGGGGIFSCVLIIISDIVSIRDRGKFQGLIGATFGLASVIAPLLGGAFSDNGLWRWCFYINLPLGAITLFTVIAFLNFPPEEGSLNEKIGRIDFLGAVVLFAAILCLVTPLQLGGSLWDWNAPQTIALLVLSVVFFAIFAYVELKIAKEPIVPASIFINSSVPSLLAVSICLGLDSSLFWSLCVQSGKYRHFLFIGPVVMAGGMVAISFLNGDSPVVQQILSLLLFGLGCGSLIQIRILALQASVPRELIAIATAVSQTCNSLGSAIGISITGTIFNNVVTSNTVNDNELQYFVSQFITRGIPAKTSEVLQLLELLQGTAQYYPKNNTAAAAVFNATLNAAETELKNGFNGAFKTAYLALLPYPVIIFTLALFIKQMDISKAAGAKDAPMVE